MGNRGGGPDSGGGRADGFDWTAMTLRERAAAVFNSAKAEEDAHAALRPRAAAGQRRGGVDGVQERRALLPGRAERAVPGRGAQMVRALSADGVGERSLSLRRRIGRRLCGWWDRARYRRSRTNSSQTGTIFRNTLVTGLHPYQGGPIEITVLLSRVGEQEQRRTVIQGSREHDLYRS